MLNTAESSRNAPIGLPSLPHRPSSFQTPPNVAQGEVVRLKAELASVKQELDAMKLKARLGDYAGGLFNFLKQNSPSDARLKGHANTVADKLRAAEASGNPSQHP